MPPGGTVSDLYVESENGTKVALGAPPAAPTTVPTPPSAPPAAPVSQPVRGVRMADQDASGNVRDTSMEAVTQPGRDLNFRNVDDETLLAKQDAKAAAPPQEGTKPADTTPAPPAPANTPAPEKLYAGKYKSVEEMEKAYTESQRLMHEATEKAARLEREVTARAATPPAPIVESPEVVAAKQAKAQQVLQEFVNDPEGYFNRIREQSKQETLTALTVQQIAQQWKDANPDIAKDEVRVAFEATLLAQSDPELARDPAALLQRATTQWREVTGRLRTEGAKEALTQETRVIPLTSTTPSPATEHPPQAPLTADAAFEAHIKMLKDAQAKSRHGLHH